MDTQNTNIVPPVLFIVFNRPETTRKVFDAIRAVRPTKLYVAADGPRAGKAGEAERCSEVRRIATTVDWDCEVKTFFRERNVGCGVGPYSAMDWFFEHEEEGIILEDDCLPSSDFFVFCAQLLERYRHDSRVMEIGGFNLLKPSQRTQPDSYFFSNHNNIWGWATWRRAWQLYDYRMTQYPLVKQQGFLDNLFGSKYEELYFKWVFELTYRVPSVTWWDYQWEFVRRINSGLTIFPVKNLVVNIGFGSDATHTFEGGESSKMVLEKMDFPLQHPVAVLPNVVADHLGFLNYHSTPKGRVKNLVKSMLPASVQNRLFETAIDRAVRAYDLLPGRPPEQASVLPYGQ
jgi:hypothetical protein